MLRSMSTSKQIINTLIQPSKSQSIYILHNVLPHIVFFNYLLLTTLKKLIYDFWFTLKLILIPLSHNIRINVMDWNLILNVLGMGERRQINRLFVYFKHFEKAANILDNKHYWRQPWSVHTLHIIYSF